MKKLFTLALALMGFAGAANAATVDDLAVLKHSYVLVCDQLGSRPGKGVLFGNDHFLDVKSGGTTATNKGTVDLSVVDGNDGYVTQEIVDKYGADYAGPHYNWLRLKNQQDMIALRLTAKSKIIIFEQGNNKSGTAARIPRISTDEAQSNSLNAAPDADHPSTVSGFRWEFTVEDDGTYYLGSYNGDMFISFIIIEANEAPGTPTVKVGDQTFEGGLWFREVTCKANDMVEEGSTEKIPTVVTYTTDGTAPTAASPIYTAPIKCYQDMTVKFQAFMDFGDGKPSDEFICDGADNDGNVNFSFDAPSLEVNGASVKVVSPYEGQGAINFLNLGETDIEDSEATLTESATVTAYTKIENGNYGSFKSKSVSKDVYVLSPIKEKKTIAVTSADVVVDEEATAAATDGSTVYKVENGAISADKADFFVKNLSWSVLKDAKAQYQVPNGQEAYIQMSNTNITFLVAAGDKVNVKVTCSENACKNIDADDAEDGSQVNDRKCYVNVSGTNYCHLDADGNEAADQKLFDDANIIEFELAGGKTVKQNVKDADGNDVLGEDGKAIQEEVFDAADTYYTFQKYSGTGNILISSIEFTPVAGTAQGPVMIDNFEPKTYEYSGSWAGNWWNQGENEAMDKDVTAYDYVFIKYNGNTGKFGFGIIYAEWKQTDPWGETYYTDSKVIDNAEGIVAIPIEKTKVLEHGINNVDNQYKGDVWAKHVRQVYLQDQGAAVNVNVEGIWYGTQADLDAMTTGIKVVNAAKAQDGVLYNLAGQKVDASYKGVVIKNGVKIYNNK